ncbi:MAG TPA: hypothetical protein PLI09_00925 [Candidatus Hydrogenedentes bacterium]|nr:hypothetical protein [Candidatus Hydrogenedentota bacterium]
MDVQPIASIENEVEANVLEALLTEENIPHIIQSNYNSAYDGVFQKVEGWGWIQAPPEHAARIHALITELRAQRDAATE